tara:strand:- start:250 stop:513 length:264 start_codon:yes stop_codon:yes gene_type:complete
MEEEKQYSYFEKNGDLKILKYIINKNKTTLYDYTETPDKVILKQYFQNSDKKGETLKIFTIKNGNMEFTKYDNIDNKQSFSKYTENT